MRWLICGIVLLVVLGFVLLKWRSGSTPKIQFANTEEKMKWLADQAVITAKESYSIQLDYTPASIEKAEQALGHLHDEYKAGKLPTGYRGMAMAFGAYIGEVIRRSDPQAKWGTDHPVAGPSSYPLTWKGGDSFPIGWCYKRIVDGPDDNVWLKYRILNNVQYRNQISATTQPSIMP